LSTPDAARKDDNSSDSFKKEIECPKLMSLSTEPNLATVAPIPDRLSRSTTFALYPEPRIRSSDVLNEHVETLKREIPIVIVKFSDASEHDTVPISGFGENK
jgi:hypothetical protein